LRHQPRIEIFGRRVIVHVDDDMIDSIRHDGSPRGT
jgi:hypothetical protein